jgi:hypothetical protein
MRGHAMIRAMMKATAKVIKEMPWWQKVIIGSAATVAFSAAVKVMEYFIQEIEPVNKKSDKLPPEDKLPFPESAGSAEGFPLTRR